MESELKRPRILLSPVRSLTMLEGGCSSNEAHTQRHLLRRYQPVSPLSNVKSCQQQRPKRRDRRRSSATIPLARSKEELENLLISANIDPNKPVFFFYYIKMNLLLLGS